MVLQRKSVFEHLSNVHCTDIDEVWPGFSNLSLVCPMKLSFTAQEEWTIGVINYAAVGNEFVLQIETYPSLHVRDQSPQLLFAVSVQQHIDAASATGADEHS